jgi:ABC-2 type transport system permease protein
MFSSIIAIYRKELQGYFASPFAYAIAGIFWLIAGFFFLSILFGPQGIIAQAAYRDRLGISEPLDVPYEALRLFLGTLGSLSLFLLPMLSMNLYTEEKKLGTLELLATSPLTNWAIALGKLLAVATFYLTMLLPLIIYEVMALTASSPPLSATLIVSGHVGLLLLGTSVLSLGMFVSSLTDKTILAAILTFALVLFLWVVDIIAGNLSGAVGNILSHLSLVEHFQNISQGILDPSSIVLFLSYIFLGIFLTAQSIETFRFQRY